MTILPNHRIGRYLSVLNAREEPITLVTRINTKTFTATVYDRAGGCGLKRRYQRLQLSADAPPDLVNFFLHHGLDAERPRSLAIKRRRPYRHTRWATATCTACEQSRCHARHIRPAPRLLVAALPWLIALALIGGALALDAYGLLPRP